jgi:hypothetical protein
MIGDRHAYHCRRLPFSGIGSVWNVSPEACASTFACLESPSSNETAALHAPPTHPKEARIPDRVFYDLQCPILIPNSSHALILPLSPRSTCKATSETARFSAASAADIQSSETCSGTAGSRHQSNAQQKYHGAMYHVKLVYHALSGNSRRRRFRRP